jgi:hypothetical protein
MPVKFEDIKNPMENSRPPLSVRGDVRTTRRCMSWCGSGSSGADDTGAEGRLEISGWARLRRGVSLSHSHQWQQEASYHSEVPDRVVVVVVVPACV